MRKLFLSFLIIAIHLFTNNIELFAQSSGIEFMFNKYGNAKNATVVNITGEMFKMMKEMNVDVKDKSKDAMDLVQGIEGMRILTVENDPKSMQEFRKDFEKNVNTNDFSKLMDVKTNDELVQFLIERKGERVSEFLMFVAEKNEGVLIHIVGDLDLKKLQKISQGAGMGDLQEILKGLPTK